MLKFIHYIRNLGINHSDNLLEKRIIRLMNDLLISIFIIQAGIFVPFALTSKDYKTFIFSLFIIFIVSFCFYITSIGKSYLVRIWFCWIIPLTALVAQIFVSNPPSYHLILIVLLTLNLVLNQNRQIRFFHLLYCFFLYGIYSFFVHEHILITLSPKMFNIHEKVQYIIILFLLIRLISKFGSVSETIEQKLQQDLEQLKNDNLALQENQAQMQNQNEELEKVNKELEKFAYIASHDLKSPIRNVNSFLTLIQRRLKNYDDQDVQEYLKYATDNATQMYQLVEDILTFSKITEKPEEYEWVNLNEVIFVAIEQLSDFLKSKNGKIEFNQLPSIIAHKQQLIILFVALIKNGLLYNANPTPTVKITYQVKSDCHEISVKDNGIGIEAIHFDLIFTIFKRLHTQVEYQGTGVGLAISKKITKLHKGDISVKSELHKGSEFIIKLGKENKNSIEL